MSSLYFNIYINEGKFEIRKLPAQDMQNIRQKKGGLGLTTLERIEEVLRKELTYSGENQNDNYCMMTQTQLREQLKLMAESIKGNYFKKSQSISCVRRFFGSVAQKEQAIQKVYKRIENLATPLQPVFDLSSELIGHICNFLPISDLANFAHLNKHALMHVKEAEIQRAREYGYKGLDFAEAKNYLNIHFQVIVALAKSGFIPKEFVVKRGKWPFGRYVDAEATLRNIGLLNPKKREVLKTHFNKALLAFSNSKGCVNVVKVLLHYGVDSNIADDEGFSPLHLATKNGDMPTVLSLLEHGAKLDAKDNEGNTPLMFAVNKSYKELVTLLLERGADPNISNNSGRRALCLINSSQMIAILAEKGANLDYPTGPQGSSALHYASNNGQIERVKALLEHGANPNITNALGKTPLMHSVDNNQYKVASLLLEGGADPNISDNNGATALSSTGSAEFITLLAKYRANLNCPPNQRGYSSLHFAAENEEIGRIEGFLQAGVDPNTRDLLGKTPLMIAVGKSIEESKAVLKSKLSGSRFINDFPDTLDFFIFLIQESVFNYFLKHKADLNARDNFGKTPLMYAVAKGNKEFVTLLLKNGADINLADHQGLTALNYTTSFEMIALLAGYRANLNLQATNGSTALHYAVEKGQIETVEALLGHGANTDVKDNFGKTPLMIAVAYGNKDLVTLLLKKGADPNICDVKRYGALNYADSTDIIQLLAKKGANLDLQTRHNGYTALHFALEKGHIKRAKALLRHGANPNIRDNSGRTPLIIAAAKDNEEMVTLLLNKGADPNIADDKGITPLFYSSAKIRNLLIKKGAKVN